MNRPQKISMTIWEFVFVLAGMLAAGFAIGRGLP